MHRHAEYWGESWETAAEWLGRTAGFNGLGVGSRTDLLTEPQEASWDLSSERQEMCHICGTLCLYYANKQNAAGMQLPSRARLLSSSGNAQQFQFGSHTDRTSDGTRPATLTVQALITGITKHTSTTSGTPTPWPLHHYSQS
jgi:hypothetical protein